MATTKRSTFGSRLSFMSRLFLPVQSTITLTAAFKTWILSDPRRVFLRIGNSSLGGVTIAYRIKGSTSVNGLGWTVGPTTPLDFDLEHHFVLPQYGLDLLSNPGGSVVDVLEVIYIGP